MSAFCLITVSIMNDSPSSASTINRKPFILKKMADVANATRLLPYRQIFVLSVYVVLMFREEWGKTKISCDIFCYFAKRFKSSSC